MTRHRVTPPNRAIVFAIGALLLASVVPALADSSANGADASPASSAVAERSAKRGTISLTPTKYIAGEYLTITGNVGASGVRPIVLQRYMRDHYIDAERGRTDGQGNFRFRVRGPGMATPYSVLAPSLKGRTAAAPVQPIEQDFRFAYTPAAPVAGERVGVRVAVNPARAGRPMTLLRRVSPSRWTAVGTGRTDAAGVASFGVVAGAAGTDVYRAVAGALPTQGINDFPSYPSFLRVYGSRQQADQAEQAQNAVRPSAGRVAPEVTTAGRKPYTQPGPVNAGNTFKWGAMAEAHEWEYGETLAPWVEYGSGSGRAAHGWGMLSIESGPGFFGADDLGTTRATLGGKGNAYGRWEIRMRAPNWQDGPDYRVKAELVPTDTAPGACSNQTITFADFTGDGSTVDLGVTNGTQAWAHTQRGVVTNRDNWHTYAVEVTKKRITWFVDAKATLSLRNPKAVSGKALTPRLSLIAPDDTTQMRHTRIGTDWQRYWTLANKGTGQQQIAKAPAPKAGRDISC